MSERCFDAMECRAEDLRCAMSIHTRKITDSCRDKDCIEDLRVYLTKESQCILDTAQTAKIRSAELICTAIDVSPVAFHRNHYTVDLTFYYKIIADAAVSPCRPAAICGLAMFGKRAVLCGENSGAHIFRSDAPGNSGGTLPTAVVEAIDTNSRWRKNGKFRVSTNVKCPQTIFSNAVKFRNLRFCLELYKMVHPRPEKAGDAFVPIPIECRSLQKV